MIKRKNAKNAKINALKVVNIEVKQKPSAHRTGSRHYALTAWVACFLFEIFFHDCLCKVVRRRFWFA